MSLPNAQTIIPPGGGTVGDPTDPNNPANYDIDYEYEGTDVYTDWIYGPNGTAESRTETLHWGGMIARSGASNSTHYNLSPKVVSQGTYTIRVTWVGTPQYAPTKVTLNIYSNAVHTSHTSMPSGTLSNGIGSPVETMGETPMYMQYTPERRIRTISLSNGYGEILIEKKAEGTVTGAHSQVDASAHGVHSPIDNRYCSILSIGNIWPNVRKEVNPVTITAHSSDGEAFNFDMAMFVPESAKLLYPSTSTNFSAWEFGIPTIAQQHDTYPLGNWTLTPPTLEPQFITLTGSIGYGIFGPQPTISYQWSGAGEFSDSFSGTLPYSGTYTLPSVNMGFYPDASLSNVLHHPGGSTELTGGGFHSRMKDDVTTYKLEVIFNDGVRAESVRKVTYQCAQMDRGEFGFFIDPNLNGTFRPVELVSPSNTDPIGIEDWASAGEEDWMATVVKPDESLITGSEALSLTLGKVIGLAPSPLDDALSIITTPLADWINSLSPETTLTEMYRDQWNSTSTQSTTITPGNWWAVYSQEPPNDLIALFTTNIDDFHWKLDYRPKLYRHFHKSDMYDGTGFTGRTAVEKQKETDIRNAKYRYFFHLFATPSGNSQ